jgi:ATP-dependent Lon protease
MQVKLFNPGEHSLTSVVQEIQAATGPAAGPVPISVVAPFFFIKRDGIHLEDLPCGDKSRLFANNFTVQGVKIKTCKNILNRIYCYLAGLETHHLETCPFLKKVDGVYIVDLSFIPEKYRLDVKHAEEILVRSLKRWLNVVENIG